MAAMADLRTVLADLARRAGLDPENDVDARGVAGRLPGMVIAGRTPVRACIEALQQAYAVDVVEADGRLCFRRRGGAMVAELGEADLVPHDDGSLVRIVRGQETELPRQLDVVYRSPAADYQSCTQSARRLTSAARSVTTVSLPLALDDARAIAAAQRLLAEAWLERTTYAFRLTARWAHLDPADVIALTIGGRSERLRLTRLETTATTVAVLAVPDDAGVLETTAPPAVPAPRTAEPRILAPTVLFALDLPLLRDQDDGPGWYAAASYDPARGAWPGAVLLESLDAGASFARLADLRGPGVWGVCETVLGPGPTVHWDEATRLRVRIAQGELEGRERAAVLNGANAAVVGGEIIQFRNAALVAPATYELSGLLRGRRGTEHLSGAHAADETFLLLRGSDLIRIAGRQDRIGAPSQVKAVTLGLHAEDQPAQGFVNGAAGLRPFSIAHPRGRREANGDWQIGWTRRTRRGGGWIDGSDVALGENTLQFEVAVLDGDGSVRRRIATGATAAVYDAAMQSEDFGVPCATLRLSICQISGTVGRGIPREVIL